jgi:regulator of sigma E protease
MLYSVVISVIGFLIAIGILITVHEFGHFWVARRFGIKVLRFSIGFGRPFFRWYDKHGTEYVLSTLPFGGYVALFGERGFDVPESERHMAFSNKPVLQRIAVLLAGPLFNLGFAVIAYWLMFMIGISSVAPILGPIPGKSAAEIAGLKQNQEIVSIDHQITLSWEAVSVALIAKIGENKTVSVMVRDGAKGPETNHSLDLSGVENQGADILKDLGLIPLDPVPPVVGSLMPGMPAELAGIQAGDRIVAINGRPIKSRTEATEYIQPQLDKSIQVTVERNAEKKNFTMTPVARATDEGKTAGFIGVVYSTHEKPPTEYVRTLRFGPIKAFKEAAKRTWNYTVLTLEMLKKMILGKVSLKHLNGPIAIAQYAGYSVSIGIEYFLSFLAVVSISLGVLNILPIPILDGGHILYCLVELITGRPVSEHTQMIGMWIGGLIILAVTIIAIYNDLARF